MCGVRAAPPPALLANRAFVLLCAWTVCFPLKIKCSTGVGISHVIFLALAALAFGLALVVPESGCPRH